MSRPPRKGPPRSSRPPRRDGKSSGPKGRRSDARLDDRKPRDRGPRDRGPKFTPAQAARKAAAEAVADVMGRGYRLEGSLARSRSLEGLDARDRAFARAIAATTIRRFGQIQAVLNELLDKMPPGRTEALLQTAAAQMIYMDVAPHAAVGDTVTLVKANDKSEPFSGLVNAVLRNVADKGKALAARTPPIENLPKWLRGDWNRAYGTAEVRRMALLMADNPPLDLSVKSDPKIWAEKLGGQILGGSTVRLESIGNIAAMEGFEEGAWWAQDVAASLPARVLEQVCQGLSRKRVADLCAAPGGKTMQLCAMGADVTAIDLSEARLERVHENLKRTGFEARVIAADLTEYQPDEPFEAVLLDAPCSATGTFRRHPDVLYNRRPKDITSLTKLQDKLLAKAADYVKPGGILVYAVCSLQPREGLDRVNRLVKNRSDFRLIPLTDAPGLALPEARFENGVIRIVPTDAPDGRGMDGFFIAALRKESV